MPPTSVHFNGSVNLPDAETVMREIASRIPRGLRRMTEGETGERNLWIQFQIKKFLTMPEFESAGTIQIPGQEDTPRPPVPQLRLAEGVAASDLRWPDLGYASAYAKSYATFRALQDDGTIPPGVRFQLQYPTPLASVSGRIVDEDHDAVTDSYESALFADVDRALGQMPHDKIALQWDVAVEIGLLEGWIGTPAEIQEIVPALGRCVDRVPGDVPVGMHLCYGDNGHQHFKQPDSLQVQVRLANALSRAAGRPVNWFAFTVPQARRENAYFAPLRELRVDAETELDFALVPYHPADQAPGTTDEQIRLIDGHLAESPSGSRPWGICTECGMGRVHANDVAALLDLHREILEARP